MVRVALGISEKTELAKANASAGVGKVTSNVVSCSEVGNAVVL